MRRQLIYLLAFAMPLLPQDTVELRMQKIAGTADEAEATKLLQDFFGGRDAIRALQSRINKEPQIARTTTAAARAVARERAERRGHSAARLRAGSARMFRESGSSNMGSGNTSAVARTSATEFISMALESGAVTSSTDKSAATFQLNALPAWQFLSQGKGPFGCGGIQTRIDSPGTGICEKGVGYWLRGLTGSVSFNVNSKETAVPVLSTATGSNAAVANGIRVLSNSSKLSAAGVKWELFQRERDTGKQEEALKTMTTALNTSLEESGLALDLNNAIDEIVAKRFFLEWVKRSVAGALPVRADKAKLVDYANRQFAELGDLALADASLNRLAALEKIQGAYDAYVNKIAELEAANLFKKSMAFDFVHSRPTDQPALNTVRLDLNKPLGKQDQDNKTGAAASLDFNAGFAFYNQEQKIQDKNIRLRNASASLALNYRLASWGDLGSPVLTLAGYYQYMFNNGLIEFNSNAFTPGASSIPLRGPALEVLNTKGSIGLGQLRLEIPLGSDSGLTFPIAFSYANRTELIKDPNRKFWQGHIGLSYDLSKLQEAFLKNKKKD